MVQHGKQPGGIDTHQSVRLGAAECRIPQTVIVRIGAQVRKALLDDGILHRGNPEPFHGLLAARQFVDTAKDQLALVSGVAGVHSLQELRLSMFEYIEGFYNAKRPHSSLGMMTPNEKEEWYWVQFKAAVLGIFSL